MEHDIPYDIDSDTDRDRERRLISCIVAMHKAIVHMKYSNFHKKIREIIYIFKRGNGETRTSDCNCNYGVVVVVVVARRMPNEHNICESKSESERKK